MKKYFLFFLFCCFYFPIVCRAQQDERYVRKMLEPDFFIPDTDKFNRPEKLPPIYLNGKKITAVAHQQSESSSLDSEPNYKKKYKQYHNDLENVAINGEVKPNEELSDALDSMKDGDVFEVKEKPSQESDVKNRFEKALVETLKKN